MAAIDQEVLEVADVEPRLTFPARIGLVRIHNGQMTNPTAQEVEAWGKAAARLGEDFGEFVPVSALVAGMVHTLPKDTSQWSAASANQLIRKIRLGAARQHLDVVLVYELFSKNKEVTLPTSVANWSIIGMYTIGSEKVTTVGHANAMLLDVRNGYPYGTASTSVEESDVFTLVGKYDKTRNLADRNRTAAAMKLIPEVEQMMRDLRYELLVKATE